MKQFFAGALLLSCLSLPASASSIETIDDMVTGPKGSPSIIVLGAPQPCEDQACVDSSGGAINLNTGSATQQASLQTAPAKGINFDFARKYPDPANPVAMAAPESEGGSTNPLIIPTAPSDAGTIAAQPPVQSQPDIVSMGAPGPGAPETLTRGSIDPNAPVMPVINSELRDGE